MKSEKNYIFSYSALEQKRHKIIGIGSMILHIIGIYPFMVMAVLLYSCFVKLLTNGEFKLALILSALALVLIMAVKMLLFINDLMTVYMIDEKGIFYRLKISNFWYKIKNQTMLLNPTGMTNGRFMRIFYMVSNIKIVLENISETVSFDELIAMGRLEKISEIKNVDINKKTVTFYGKIKNAKSENIKKITIRRVYEFDHQLINYLQNKDYSMEEPVKKIVAEVTKPMTNLQKMKRFAIVWTAVMMWFSVIILGGDLSKQSKINAGIYNKTVMTVEEEGGTVEKTVYLKDNGEYFLAENTGKLYKPVILIYGTVLFIYLVSKGMDEILKKTKK